MVASRTTSLMHGGGVIGRLSYNVPMSQPFRINLDEFSSDSPYRQIHTSALEPAAERLQGCTNTPISLTLVGG